MARAIASSGSRATRDGNKLTHPQLSRADESESESESAEPQSDALSPSRPRGSRWLPPRRSDSVRRDRASGNQASSGGARERGSLPADRAVVRYPRSPEPHPLGQAPRFDAAHRDPRRSGRRRPHRPIELGDEEATSSERRVIAWVEPGEANLEFDARRAKPMPGSFYGVALRQRNERIRRNRSRSARSRDP